jgi:hypothetical protein
VASTELGELQEELTVSESVRAERLARQVERMATHINTREVAMQRAEARAAHLENVTDALYLESRILRDHLSQARDCVSQAEARAKQSEDAYRAVMALKTMRLLRRPRALYARLFNRGGRSRESPDSTN